jgi:hypothetical protein
MRLRANPLDTASEMYITGNPPQSMEDNIEEYGDESLHQLTLGDICTVASGKFSGRTVIVIKAGIQTKFGLKAITVEYSGEHKTGEKIWVEPELLTFNGATDLDTANAIKEADYQEWKARKNAGVPPASQFNKKPYYKKSEDRKGPSSSDDVPF